MPHKRLLAQLGLIKLGLMIAVMVAPNAATAENGALDHIVKAGIVRIAVPDNFPPFGTLGADGKLEGYDIDTAALVAAALGVKLDLVPVQSTDRIPDLTAGKVDLVISSLGKNADREKVIDFSTAYAPFFSAVFGPERLQVATPADLAGKTIAVTRDTIEDTVLTKLAPPTATIKRFDDNARTEIAFLSNQTELIATGNSIAGEALAKSLVKTTALKFLLQNSPCYIGVSKGAPDLLARVDSIIDAARKDGSLDKISQHWLRTPLGDPEHPDLISAK
jgi:polar amino acid transport system substrate-binding protein